MRDRRQRAPRRRPWQEPLRAGLLAGFVELAARLERVNFAAVDDETLYMSDMLHEALAATRCHKCGCSEYDPCEGGCAWASMDPPLCTACVPGDAISGPKMRNAHQRAGDLRSKPPAAGADPAQGPPQRRGRVGKAAAARSPRPAQARPPAATRHPHPVPNRGRTR